MLTSTDCVAKGVITVSSNPRERIEPGPGQESVWDYPRPPRVEPTDRRVRVVHAGHTLADTTAAHRVLETSHPPNYYIPPADVDTNVLHKVGGGTVCEWKGRATYYDVVLGDETTERAVWTYDNPTPDFASIAGCFCFYPAAFDACYVDDEKARPQSGAFYGGWITSDVVGPFKGSAGTMFW